MRPDHDDWQLLRAYIQTGSETAFASLVRRYVDQVYAMALRQTRDPHLAQDATQAVFLILVRKARSLPAGTILPGWFFTTTRFVTQTMLRTERRRLQREMTAMQEFTDTSHPPETTWEELSPHIDHALASLKEKDRDIVLLRFFQRKTVRDVGQTMGMSEDAVQKRTSRAVEKLRHYFDARGIRVSAGTLVAGVLAGSAEAAPAAVMPAVLHTLQAPGQAGLSVLAAARGAGRLLLAAQAWKPAVAGLAALTLLPVAGSFLRPAAGSNPAGFDLARHFALAANPNGPWSYGAKESLDAPLALATFRQRTALQEEVWAYQPGSWPAIFHNASSNTIHSPQGRFEPGSIWLAAGEEPGPLHFGVIRFTVPASAPGRYRLETRASLGAGGQETSDADFHVLHNATELFSQVLQFGDAMGYTNSLSLIPGDTLDLLVGRGPDGRQRGSIVKLEARLIPTR